MAKFKIPRLDTLCGAVCVYRNRNGEKRCHLRSLWPDGLCDWHTIYLGPDTKNRPLMRTNKPKKDFKREVWMKFLAEKDALKPGGQ